jgi:large subunit ribosomal protein L13
METTSIRAEEITHDWYIVDADNQTLGRLASRVAQI